MDPTAPASVGQGFGPAAGLPPGAELSVTAGNTGDLVAGDSSKEHAQVLAAETRLDGRVPPLFGAASGGPCASKEHAQVLAAESRLDGRVPPLFGAASGGPCASKEHAQVLAAESRLDGRVPPLFGAASGGPCASKEHAQVLAAETRLHGRVPPLFGAASGGPCAAKPFDAHAASYDRQFTNTTTGTRMRRAVWKRCEARFRRGASILEMNCGTGEDARWLAEHEVEVLATDISPAMLAVAQAKLDSSPARNLVRFRELAWENLATLNEGPFDGALSNFGGLNCVEDLRPVAQALAEKLRPGAIAILCIMGPVVPWEWVRFLAKGNPSAAFRRLKRGGTQWSGATIRYPSIGHTRQAFSPEFRMLRVSAVGSILPVSWLADHYLMELERL